MKKLISQGGEETGRVLLESILQDPVNGFLLGSHGPKTLFAAKARARAALNEKVLEPHLLERAFYEALQATSMTNPGKIQLTLSITQAERLKRLADIHGLPLAALIGHAVNQWVFDNYKDHLDKFA